MLSNQGTNMIQQIVLDNPVTFTITTEKKDDSVTDSHIHCTLAVNGLVLCLRIFDAQKDASKWVEGLKNNILALNKKQSLAEDS